MDDQLGYEQSYITAFRQISAILEQLFLIEKLLKKLVKNIAIWLKLIDAG